MKKFIQVFHYKLQESVNQKIKSKNEKAVKKKMCMWTNKIKETEENKFLKRREKRDMVY